MLKLGRIVQKQEQIFNPWVFKAHCMVACSLEYILLLLGLVGKEQLVKMQSLEKKSRNE